MTAVIGIVIDDVAYLAADRMVTLNNAHSQMTKIHPHPSSDAIAFAAAGAPMLTYPAQLIDPPADHQAPDRDWANRYWARLLTLATPTLSNGNLDGNLLVATPGAVTLIGNSGYPHPIDTDGVSLGTGGDYALGAFHGIRAGNPTVPITVALEFAITIACRLDPNSAGPVDITALPRTAITSTTQCEGHATT